MGRREEQMASRITYARCGGCKRTLHASEFVNRIKKGRPKKGELCNTCRRLRFSSTGKATR